MLGLGRRHFSLTLILLAAVMGWWLSQPLEDRLFTPQPLSRHEPDYYLGDFMAAVATEDGQFRYHLSGANMSHYPDADSAEIDQPHVVVNMNAGVRWEITADHATADQNTAYIQLTGQVLVSRFSADQVAEDLMLKTELLDIYVNENYAKTEADVQIARATGITRAQGMHINFPQRHLYLKSNVRGEYESGG